MCPELGHKSESNIDGLAHEREDKSTLGLQETEAGLGLGAEKPTGSGVG